jgi:hypothetical protein
VRLLGQAVDEGAEAIDVAIHVTIERPSHAWGPPLARERDISVQHTLRLLSVRCT